jgi:hypothetical protein
VSERQSAESVVIEREALVALLDWFDDVAEGPWPLDVIHAAQRLRLLIDGSDDAD